MRINWGAAYLGLGTAFVIATCFAILSAGIRINTSESMPLGIWRVIPAPPRLERGMIVAVCMPDTPITKLALRRGYFSVGWCPSHTELLPKPIGAIAGDVVKVDLTGISVNGKSISYTAQMSTDFKGRGLPAMPAGEYKVAEGYIWLVAPYNPLSFDSRYFGEIPITAVQGLASPVLVW